jgi:hypothetical protein
MLSSINAALLLLQEAGQPQGGNDTIVKVVCGVLALVLVGIVIMRRKSKKKQEDDF